MVEAQTKEQRAGDNLSDAEDRLIVENDRTHYDHHKVKTEHHGVVLGHFHRRGYLSMMINYKTCERYEPASAAPNQDNYGRRFQLHRG